jgi:hypothetical protein
MRMFMGKRDIVLYFDRKKRWCLDISYVYIYIYILDDIRYIIPV